MVISVSTLAKGAAGASLLGGGITGGALYENSKKNHSDFVNKFEKIVVTEISNPAQITTDAQGKVTIESVTLTCKLWTDDKFSHLTREEKLLGCVRGWIDKHKQAIKLGKEQWFQFSRLLGQCENWSSSSEHT